jgi:hypothetical protein
MISALRITRSLYRLQDNSRAVGEILRNFHLFLPDCWLEAPITFRKLLRSATFTPVFLVFLCLQANAEMLQKIPQVANACSSYSRPGLTHRSNYFTKSLTDRANFRGPGVKPLLPPFCVFCRHFVSSAAHLRDVIPNSAVDKH